MTSRGVDIGQSEATAYANSVEGASLPVFEITAKYPSSDGRKWFFATRWSVNIPAPTQTLINPGSGDGTITKKVANRMVILDGALAVWSEDGVDVDFTNRYGDHVTLRSSGPNSFVLADTANTGNTISLSLQLGDTTTYGVKNFQVNQATGTLTVSNTLGLPSVTLSGVARWGLPTYFSPLNTGLQGASEQGEFGFTPQTSIQTGSDNVVVTTTWSWGLTGIEDTTCQSTTNPSEFFPCAVESPITQLNSITFPNGSVESYSYGPGVNLSAGAFMNGTGKWIGYRAGYPPTQIVSSQPASPTKMSAVWRVTRDGGASNGTILGETILIERKVPLISQAGGGAAFSFSQGDHETWVLKYPTLNVDSDSPFRGVHLIHPTGTADVQTNPATLQAFLFATSVVMAKETIHGVGGPSAMSWTQGATDPKYFPTSCTKDAVTIFDGWDLRSWSNPDGSLTAAQPVTPTPLRSVSVTDQLSSVTRIAGLPGVPGARDAWGPLQTDECTNSWPGSLPTVNPAAPAAWSTDVTVPTDGVHRIGKIQRTWNATLMELLETSETKTLQVSPASGTVRYSATWNPSTQTSSLSPITTMINFGTTSKGYFDSTAPSKVGLLKEVTGTRNGYTSTETRIFEVAGPNGQILPLISNSTKAATGPNGTVPANWDDASVVAGRVYTYTQDGFHWLASETDKTTGTSVTYDSYDVMGRVLQKTSHPLNIVTRFTYDFWGRLSSQTDAVGTSKQIKTDYFYDPDGLWTTKTVTSAEGVSLTTKATLDGFGRVVCVEVTKGDGGVVSRQTFQYDGWGQKVAESPVLPGGLQPYGNTTYHYDARGRVVWVKDPKGNYLSRVPVDASTGLAAYPKWDSQTLGGESIAGIWSSTLDDRGYTRTEVWDLLGQKIAVIDQNDQLSRYKYDQDGHLIHTEQPDGSGKTQLREYAYNDMGWLVARTEPEEGTTTYGQWNLFGVPRVTATVGRLGSSMVTTTSILNHFNAPGTITVGDGATSISRTFTYDSLNRMASMTDIQPNGEVTELYGYDELSRLTAKTITDTGASLSFLVSQTLDSLGNVTSLTYPSGGGRPSQTATTSYDDQGRPWIVKMDGSLRGMMTYDQFSGASNTTILTYGNGVSTTSTVDKGELVETDYTAQPTPEIFPTGMEKNALTWTPGGLLTDRGADHFDYDPLQRLVHSRVRGLYGEVTEQWYGYDRWGNRTAHDWAYLPTTTSSQSKPDEVVAYRASYDGGNRLTSSVMALIPGSWRGGAGAGTTNGTLDTGAVYDDLGRIISVSAVPNNQGLKVSSWYYDPSGRVTRETIEGAVWSYLLDGEGLRFKRIRQDGTADYTVYGFHRDPLVTLEKPPQTMATLLSTKPTSSKKPTPSTGTTTTLSGGGGVPCGAYITRPSIDATLWAGQAISFQGSTDFGTTYSWKFGDGTTSGGASSTHTYANPGNYTVVLTVTGTGYTSSSTSLSITVHGLPIINSVTASPASIWIGQTTTLSWNVSGAAPAPGGGPGYQISIKGTYVKNGITYTTTVNSVIVGGGQLLIGSATVLPEATTTYTITATNAFGSVSASVVVGVGATPPIINSFLASSTTVAPGQSVALNWSVTSATSLALAGAGGAGGADHVAGVRDVTGVASITVKPLTTTTYMLEATNPAGTSTFPVTVTVVNQVPVITDFFATPSTITAGQSATLSWYVSQATSLTVDGVAVTGSTMIVVPSKTTVYQLSATNAAGTSTATCQAQVKGGDGLTWKRTVVYGFGQELAEEQDGTQGALFVQSDYVGSPSLITDHTGKVVGRQKALPFGERYGQWGSKVIRRYTNHEDQDGSPIYMQARMYLPAYGKFAEVDPAYDQTKDDPETWNLYNYVTNNPVTHTDPDGRTFATGTLQINGIDLHPIDIESMGNSPEPGTPGQKGAAKTEASGTDSKPEQRAPKPKDNPTVSSDKPAPAKTPAEAASKKTENIAQTDKPTVAVDPGHGDHNNKNNQVDPGAVSGKDYEKDIALNISNAVTASLKAQGFGVVQTRTGDVDDAGTKLQWRIDQATGASILVSVHINSSESAKANGFSVCYKPGDDSSKKLASSISAANTQFADKGISGRSDLFVLNKFKGTAVLVEAGFISNPRDLSIMKNNAATVGRDIASGIINYWGSR
jgi:RHS repeat-associated protein